MGSKGSAPASPDYASIIPLQERSNINQFNAMLGASRINSQTPFGAQTWIRPGGFGAIEPGGNVLQPQAPSASQNAAPERRWVDLPSDIGGAGYYEDSPASSGGDGSFQGVDNVYGGAASGDPWTLIQSLSPEQQALYEQDLRIRGGQGNIAEGMMGRVAQEYSDPAKFAGMLPGFQQNQWGGPTYKTNMNSRDAAEKAIYDRQMRYAAPQMAEDKRAQQDRLIAQGFNINSPAAQKAMDQLNLAQERQRADIRDQAILGGGQEASAELGRGIAAETPRFGAGMQNQNQALQYALANMNASAQDRARYLNEMNAFRTGQQVQLPGTPGQTSVPNLQGIDQLGIANQDYNNQLGAYNAEQAAGGNFLNGLFGLGSAWALGGFKNPFG